MEQLDSREHDKLEQQIKESYLYCRKLTKKTSNFFLGILLTKTKKKRDALFSLYAWLHTIDHIIDNKRFLRNERLQRLEKYFDHTHEIFKEKYSYIQHPSENYWLAFRRTIIDFHIPFEYIEVMMNGQRQDLLKVGYQNFNELYHYCHSVASVVGLMCVHIWGIVKDQPTAKKKAEWLGIAFQLTNILRDVPEDLKLNRVYLPADFVGVEKISSKNFKAVSKENLMQGVMKLIKETEEYFKQSQNLYEYVHHDGKLSLLVMIGFYNKLFTKIQKNPKLVFSDKKIKLNLLEKIWVVVSAIIKSHK